LEEKSVADIAVQREANVTAHTFDREGQRLSLVDSAGRFA